MKKFLFLLAVLFVSGAIFWSFRAADSSLHQGEETNQGEEISTQSPPPAPDRNSTATQSASTPSIPAPEDKHASPAATSKQITPSSAPTPPVISPYAEIAYNIASKATLVDERRSLSTGPSGETLFTDKNLYASESKRTPYLLLEEKGILLEDGTSQVQSAVLYVGDQALVELDSSTAAAEFEDWANGSPVQIETKIPNSNLFIIQTTERNADAVDSMIELVEREFADQIIATRNAINYPTQSNEVIPNDSNYSELWGMEKIYAPFAWSRSTGSASVLVAVIDSSVQVDHPDLAGNIWTNPADPVDGIDNDLNGYIDDINGWDFADDDNDPSPDNNNDVHGTHVAGTVGAVGNNNRGVTGVNWTTSILPIRFLAYDPFFNQTYGSDADAIQSILYSTLMGCDLSNNSWGGPVSNPLIFNAIKAAGDSGILFVAAAGNYLTNNDSSPYYPAYYSLSSANVITVASSDQNDDLSVWDSEENPGSNYGQQSVQLAAPGTSILSTFPGSTYGTISGTSMAAPHVAGALALLIAAEPGLSSSELKSRLLNSVDAVPSLTAVVSTGGRLNVASLLNVSTSDIGNGTGLELVGSMTWSDSTSYSPHNNGNGVFEAGETVGIIYTVINNSDETLAVLQSDIEASPETINNIPRGFNSLNYGNLSLGNLAPQQSVTDRNIRLFSYGNTYTPYTGTFTITIEYTTTSDGKRTQQSFTESLTITGGGMEAPETEPQPELPVLDLSNFEFSDSPDISPNNNGDGIFSPGETIGISYNISNTASAATATLVKSELSASPEEVDGVTVGFQATTNQNFALGPISAGHTKTDQNLRLFCYGNTPIPYSGSFSITVNYGMTGFDQSANVSIDVEITETKTGASTNPDAFPSPDLAHFLSALYNDENIPEDAAERDANSNGKADLLDFALPNSERGETITIAERSDDTIRISFDLRENIPLQSVKLLYSENLTSWTSVSLNEEDLESISIETGDNRKTVEVQLSGAAASAKFFRLQVIPAAVMDSLPQAI